jgi:putative MATE family efflux protein
MLNRFDEKAVAAVGLVFTIIMFLEVIFLVVGLGISVLISQNLGANQKETAYKIASNSIMASFLFGIFVSIVLTISCEPIIHALKLDPQVTKYTIDYFMVYGSLCFIVSLSCTFAAILRSYGHTKPPMYISLFTNIINVGGNYIAIFGPWGIPVTGVVGVAFSTIISHLIASVMMFIVMKKKSIVITLSNIISIDLSLLKQILIFGGSIASLKIVFSVTLTLITGIISRLGYQSMNAHLYTRLLLQYVLPFYLATQQGLIIVTGNLVGGGEFKRAYKLTLNILKIMLVFSSITLIIIYFNLQLLLRIFTTDHTTIDIAIKLAMVGIFSEFFRTVNVILLGGLRGAGDVHYVTYTGLLPRVGSLILAYLMAFHFNFGVVGVWIAQGLDEFVRGVMVLYRWLSRRWEQKVVVKKTKAFENSC